MNYVWWGIGLVVVAAAGYFIWQNVPANTLEEQGAAAETAISRQGSGSFAELAALGGSFECEVSMNMEGVSADGVVYIASENVRADFTAQVSGQSFTSHMLRTDGFVYTWSDLLPQGFKMMADDSQSSGEPVALQSGFDPNSPVQYNCNPWVADASVFVVPTNITFSEAPAAR
jgi:hypothetical protein